ncbi:MAG: hypothetical protein HY401_09085, partial [Elusimicrobia bacterium]|nr:hypothetical protein [Elusimicrobiota bacterium]
MPALSEVEGEVRKGKNFGFFILSTIYYLLSTIPLYADIAQSFHYQGRLADTTGNPLTGSYDMKLVICSKSTADDAADCDAGNQLWTEDRLSVAVTNGVFSVEAGTITAIPSGLFQGASYYFELWVDTDTTGGQDAAAADVLTPRERLLAAPYAFHAYETERASAPTAFQVFTAGSERLRIDPAGWTGIGTTSPLARLHVSSGAASTGPVMIISTGTTRLLEVTGSSFTIGPMDSYLASIKGCSAALETDSNGRIICGTDPAAGGLPLPEGATNYIQNSATLQAGSTFYVASGTVAYNLYVGSGSATGSGILTVSSSAYLATSGGNVGVGTTGPTSKFYINASGANITSLMIKTNGSIGNYTTANSGIFMYDNAGVETLRIVATDPDPTFTNYNVWNLYIGKGAGLNQPSDNVSAGFSNTGVGYEALKAITTGINNTALGAQALLANNTGGYNTAIGAAALRDNTTSIGNTAVGASAMYSNTTGGSNSAFGYSALGGNPAGSSNTAVGFEVGTGNDVNSFSNSALIGFRAGYSLTTGSNNILIGYQAGDAITSGASNIIIGYDIDAPNATGSNQLNIGNLIYGDVSSAKRVSIGTTTVDAMLRISSSAVPANGTPLLVISTGTTRLLEVTGSSVTIGAIDSYLAGIKSCSAALETDSNGRIVCGTDPAGGGLPLPEGATNYIQNTGSLQTGSTFYVSSATITNNLYVGSTTAAVVGVIVFG